MMAIHSAANLPIILFMLNPSSITSAFVVMVILLAVAAVIEGHITHLIAVWAYGL